jgi:hypothetical protein
MTTLTSPQTQNETILTLYKDCIFSENIFAWFEAGLQPVFSNKIEDLMLPENRVIQQNHFSDGTPNEGAYEIFGWDNVANQHLYTGRLYAPKGYKMM